MTTPLTNADLDWIEAEAADATPGPWSVTDKSRVWASRTLKSDPNMESRRKVGEVMYSARDGGWDRMYADARFIAAYRALATERDHYRAALKQIARIEEGLNRGPGIAREALRGGGES